MKKAGIMGGAGYTGGELIRLLLEHPHVEIAFVHSNSQAGKMIDEVHSDLLGYTSLEFSSSTESNVDIVFLCVEHGRSAKILKEFSFAPTTKIIDLSNTFRQKSSEHSFVYGLPELQKEKITKSQFIANPGCFATAIQLALLPLAKKGLLNHDIHVSAITGSTGAGQRPSDTSHFSWRNNNISIYKAFQHQHLSEIKQSMGQLQVGFDHKIFFLPHRGNFSRGIFASLYLEVALSIEEVESLFENFYQDAPFVVMCKKNPNLKQVLNTNRCLLYLEKHEDQLLIISMIDNLLKGASGQAVQNMNLQFGWPEKSGLHLKPVVY